MKPDEKARLKGLITKAAVLLAIGAAYFVFIKLTGISVPCIIKSVTGHYCPGCGITRMFVALAGLDFYTAVRSNLLITVIILPAAVFGIYRGWLYVKGIQKKYSPVENIFIILAAVLTVAFWIMRNLPQFDFLAPI